MQNYRLSETFGWTPEQISHLTDDQRDSYVMIRHGMGLAKTPKIK